MAYDPVKAHEYYEKYKKKGLKKGRKKKTSSKIKKQSLLGLSTSGLNDAGKMNWAIAKKDLQDQMNADLAKATTDEQKAEIRADYQGKALKALQDMKKDPSFAQAKNSKSGSKSSKSSKSGNKNGSKSGSKSSGSAANKSNKSKGTKAAAAKSTTSAKSISYGSASTAARTVSNEEFAKIKEMSEQIERLKAQIAVMSAGQKARLKNSIQTMIGKLKKRVKKNG